MTKEDLEKEKKYLKQAYQTIGKSREVMEGAIRESQRRIDMFSEFFSNAFYEMDKQDIAQHREILEKLQLDNLDFKKQLYVLEKQGESPYFGRIDFTADDEKVLLPLYIGIAQLDGDEMEIPMILDWRAPVCGMYYDFEIGRASYNAPIGEITGEISLKRQYKTEGENLVYAFDSNLTIGDEILRQTLGKNVDSKMQNIVSTIQKEQNKIIRGDDTKNMLIQGVAGSGKTSIALHRVAYLLYKNKISSNDILILSPTAIFGDYISNVLPELGEENTPKITFEEIAKREFEGFLHFQPRYEMLENLIEENSKIKNGVSKRQQEVDFKGSFEFFEKLQAFCEKNLNATFHAKDIKVGEKVFKAEEIEKLFNERYANKKPAVKIEWIADYFVDSLSLPRLHEKQVFNRVKKVLYNMFETTGIVGIYKDFLRSLGLELEYAEEKEQTNVIDFEVSAQAKAQKKQKSVIRFEDVPALLYIKDFLLGIETQKHYKHLIIDEMQDYSPICFHIFNVIYPCNKTILGDINQSLERNLDENYLEKLAKLIGNCKISHLNTTYRSTLQIAKFAENIIKLENVKNFNRSGEEVKVLKTKVFKPQNKKSEKIAEENINELSPSFVKALKTEVEKLEEKYDKIAIVTETQKLAKQLHFALKENKNVRCITKHMGSVGGKINIIPIAFSKGLEFDAVIMISPTNQTTSLGKHIAYVSATRALHKLIVFWLKK